MKKRQDLKNKLLPHTPMSEEQRKKKEQIEELEEIIKEIKAEIYEKESISKEVNKNMNRYKEYLKHLENVINKLTEIQELSKLNDYRYNLKIRNLRNQSDESLEKIKETLTEPIDQNNLNYHVYIHNWNSNDDSTRKFLLKKLGYMYYEPDRKWIGSPKLKDIIEFKENDRNNPTIEILEKEYFEPLKKSEKKLKRVEKKLKELKGNSEQGEGYIRIKVHKLI